MTVDHDHPSPDETLIESGKVGAPGDVPATQQPEEQAASASPPPTPQAADPSATSTAADEQPLFTKDGKATQHHPQFSSLTFVQIFATGTVILSPFMFGFHLSALNTTAYAMRFCSIDKINGLPACFDVSEAVWGTILGIFSIGGLFGSIPAGYLMDRYGRKTVLIGNTALYALGAVLQSLAVDVTMLAFGRFIAGLAAGIALVVTPTYIGETAPINHRGTLGVFSHLAITLGLLLSSILGLFMATTELWRWMLSFGAFVPLLQAIVLPPIGVESHVWLLSRGRRDDARRSLKRLRSATHNLERELDYVEKDLAAAAAKSKESISLIQLFRTRGMLFPLLLAVVILVTQQLSGINAVFFYSFSIYSRPFPNDADKITAGVSAFYFLAVAGTITVVERLGRRPLLLTSQIGMMLVGVLFTIAFGLDVTWLQVVCCFLFIAFFAVGLGPLPFLILSEMFPPNAVSSGSAVAMATNWIGAYIVAQVFPLFAEHFFVYSFLPFVGYLIFSTVFMWLYLPETRGREGEVNFRAISRMRGGGCAADGGPDPGDSVIVMEKVDGSAAASVSAAGPEDGTSTLV
ncbi:hypothetical protein H696_04647 [Fonticula alba]|uniref:Major facilitator superfamily (MFS) profile domain-containing protein n=1 Tax=Fonticula alba TaxID=691883 RepID=A0A058Z4N1_FONAL|nr:hypothetical protein H696_04647 [Fonticula alba]KCV69230.1 hypothetical protein H696_04647 [Fonticula alba]|eukprot:XP_009496801.1 hypothetical protein H696_04647 [Fonticula alba]